MRRFKDIIAKPLDNVVGTDTKFPKVKNGKPVLELKPDGTPSDKEVQIDGKKYAWKAGDGPTVWKYTYSNPEDNHRETPWATGLTLNVSFLFLW